MLGRTLACVLLSMFMFFTVDTFVETGRAYFVWGMFTFGLWVFIEQRIG